MDVDEDDRYFENELENAGQEEPRVWSCEKPRFVISSVKSVTEDGNARAIFSIDPQR